jgi:hypothetical protein
LLITGGFTCTVAVVVDLQPIGDVAVMVKVVIRTVVVMLVNTVAGTVDPAPDAANPVIFVVVFLVQLNVVPVMLFGFVISIAAIELPVQILCDEGVALTVGEGFTVLLNVLGAPVHVVLPVVKVGVTVIVAVTAEVLVFMAVNEGMFPVPVAANPMEVVLLVQLNTVPVTAPAKDTVVVDELLHTV